MTLKDLQLKILDEDGKLKRRFYNTKFIQKYLKPEEIQFLKETYPNAKAIERFWLVENNFIKKPICDKCNKDFTFISYKDGYEKCDCGNEVEVEKQHTLLESKKEKPRKITQKAYPYVKDGIPFNNGWDLAFWVFCKETNIHLERNTTFYFKFIDKNSKIRRYYPAFKMDGQWTEICNDEPFKGQENFWSYKEAIIKENNIKMISKDEMKKVLLYIRKKYGKKYIKQFRRRTDSDIKRKIIDILEEEDIEKFLYEKRNSTAKAKFVCRRCGCVSFQSARTLLHFGTLYCNTCRRRLKKEGKPYKKENTK